MGTIRTAWHVMLYALLKERRPRAFEVKPEVPFSKEPQRADYILIRKIKQANVDDARVLKGLWGRIKKDAILEYKSTSRPVEQGDLTRLLGYGAQYATQERKRLSNREDLVLVLITAKKTPTLTKEIKFIKSTLDDSDGGYASLPGLTFPAWVVFIDEVSKAEQDELLGLFGHGQALTPEAVWWWHAHLWERTMDDIRIEDLEGYEDLVAKTYQLDLVQY